MMQMSERNKNQYMKHLQEVEYAQRVNEDLDKFNKRQGEKEYRQKTNMMRYADELKEQIKKDQEKKLKENEMSPRERKLNQTGINSYMQ